MSNGEQTERRFIDSYPRNLAQIPEPWWDTLLNGNCYSIDLATFPVLSNVAQFRAFCYRRAALRNLRVVVRTLRGAPSRLLIQAYDVMAPDVFGELAAAPPEVPTVKVLAPGVSAIAEGFYEQRDQQIRARQRAIAEDRIARAKEQHRQRAIDEAAGMAAAVASFEEEWEKAEVDRMIMERCTCDSQDPAHHAPSCRAWG